ncbi:MAG: hypothetical protein U0R71_13180 [Solirubrobacterales bacterium]
MSPPRSRGERAYRGAVTGFSLVFVAIGLLVLVVTLAGGGGPASLGVLLGVAFLLVGAGRLWVNSRMGG